MLYLKINTLIFKQDNLSFQEKIVFAYINELYIEEIKDTQIIPFRVSFLRISSDLNIERRNFYKIIENLKNKKYIKVWERTLKNNDKGNYKNNCNLILILNDCYIKDYIQANKIIKELSEIWKKTK